MRDDYSRYKLIGVDKLAEVESQRQDQLRRRGWPVWSKVNRLQLLIGGGVIVAIAAWVLLVLLT